MRPMLGFAMHFYFMFILLRWCLLMKIKYRVVIKFLSRGLI